MTKSPTPVYAAACPPCGWQPAPATTAHDAVDAAGAHDDAEHGGQPTAVLVVLVAEVAAELLATGTAAQAVSRTLAAVATDPHGRAFPIPARRPVRPEARRTHP
jgi:hypothetical protein